MYFNHPTWLSARDFIDFCCHESFKNIKHNMPDIKAHNKLNVVIVLKESMRKKLSKFSTVGTPDRIYKNCVHRKQGIKSVWLPHKKSYPSHKCSKSGKSCLQCSSHSINSPWQLNTVSCICIIGICAPGCKNPGCLVIQVSKWLHYVLWGVTSSV